MTSFAWKKRFRAGTMVQQVKVPSARSQDLSSISKTRAVEAENPLLYVIL